ncbi:MAG: type II toxin-antitoxin system VapC family toxin [Stellaceae bacterium]
MSLYLDASVLVALFVIDPAGARAATFLSARPAVVVVSDFGAAEFVSAVARRVRMRELTSDDGQLAFLHFDAWVSRSASREEIMPADIGSADRILRRLGVNLRTPDAIHIAFSQRVRATLVTLDRGMAGAARALGMAVATP